MDSITYTLLVKILLNVVLVALSINIFSVVSGIIDNRFPEYRYWQRALRELLMAIVVGISYWLFILV